MEPVTELMLPHKNILQPPVPACQLQNVFCYLSSIREYAEIINEMNSKDTHIHGMVKQYLDIFDKVME